jgi:hypothetical protein
LKVIFQQSFILSFYATDMIGINPVKNINVVLQFYFEGWKGISQKLIFVPL